MKIKLFYILTTLITIFVLCSLLCDAATIYGNIYDSNLNKFQGRVEIEVNSSPRQYKISDDGTYSFFLLVGEYKIIARYKRDGLVRYIAEENIVVRDEGRFIHDIVLYPTIEEEERILNHTAEIPKFTTNTNESLKLFLIIGLIFFVTIVVVIILLRNNRFITKSYTNVNEYKHTKDDFEIAKENKGESKDELIHETISKSIGDNINNETTLIYNDDKKEIASELESVIKILKDNGGRATQKDIRKEIPLSESKISLMISELEDLGIVRKIKKGRSNIIILNELDNKKKDLKKEISTHNILNNNDDNNEKSEIESEEL